MADNVKHNTTKNYTNLQRQRARKEFLYISYKCSAGG